MNVRFLHHGKTKLLLNSKMIDLIKCQKEYADLFVLGGIQMKPGERVIIYSDVETALMARLVAESCYRHGAKAVEIRWSDVKADALQFRYGNPDELSRFHAWEEERLKLQEQELPSQIYLVASDPQEYTEEMLKKKQHAMQARLPFIRPYRDRMDNHYKWTLGGVPTKNWAKKVFPNEEDALMHLWRSVLQTVMITGDGTAVAKWDEKWAKAWANMDRLNSYQLKSLHMTTSLGTDLTVELDPLARFHAGAYREAGYAANLPSEELYTSPIAGKAEGKLVASTPLVYQDQPVEGLELTFENGRVTNVKAAVGETLMKNMISLDEGAAMIGEVAIVDKYSPIRKLGHLFYNTLYDENAACHVAVGSGFSFALEGFESMTKEEIRAHGINESGIHCDIMFGTEDTEITGVTADGKTITLMKDGTWSFS